MSSPAVLLTNDVVTWGGFAWTEEGASATKVLASGFYGSANLTENNGDPGKLCDDGLRRLSVVRRGTGREAVAVAGRMGVEAF